MKLKNILKIITVFITAATLWSCGEDPTTVMYDSLKDKTSAAPVIESISPANIAWAPIDTIIIKGQNFLADTTKTFVYFDQVKVKVASVTPTEIRIKAPNLPKDSILVKVSTQSSVQMASGYYNLKIGIGPQVTIKTEELPKAITYGKDGNLYVSLVKNNVGAGVWKYVKNEAGEFVAQQYALKGAETNWNTMKFIGDNLYGTKNSLGIWLIPQGAAPQNTPTYRTTTNVADFDVDQNGMIWAVGVNNIFRINPTTVNIKAIPYASTNIKAARVFNGYLYVAGTKAGKEIVSRFQILDADNLGAEELVFNFTDAGYTNKIQTMNIDANGKIYLGTDNTNSLYQIVNGTGSFLYPGDIAGVVKSITWIPNEEYMLYSSDLADNKGIIKVMVFSQSAPNYGLR